ncbi:MAG: DNA-directed RNA polymerase subunit omega [Corallococcus sp.]|nr:DNA-directed RNA polymerase subunit omega [Bacillota bacterium]MCM1533564.1 DNA-directed RNA polymerase subunit omega [Corallococcus sp.]
MITKPPIDELTEKAGDKYTLCCVVAKRAKELNNSPDLPQDAKPISYASEEFDQGILEISKK